MEAGLGQEGSVQNTLDCILKQVMIRSQEMSVELRACVGRQANDKSGVAFEEKNFLNSPE